MINATINFGDGSKAFVIVEKPLFSPEAWKIKAIKSTDSKVEKNVFLIDLKKLSIEEVPEFITFLERSIERIPYEKREAEYQEEIAKYKQRINKIEGELDETKKKINELNKTVNKKE